MVDYTIEKMSRMPVVRDVDVVVAGGGISGCFSAIASGRLGARTLLIERFGNLGGNIGPGGIIGGSLDGEADETLPGGLPPLPREFVERVRALASGGELNYPDMSGSASYVLQAMMKEAGVELMLSAWASAPIIEDGTVRGVSVETTAGRVAVKGRVTVDATGYAGIARRAGAPLISHTPSEPSFSPIVRPPYLDPSFSFYNDTALLILIAGADLEAYEKFRNEEIQLDKAEKRWAEEKGYTRLQPPLIRALKRAHETDAFLITKEILPRVFAGCQTEFRKCGGGVCWTRVAIRGEFDCDDWKTVSTIESEARAMAFEFIRFLRGYIDGFRGAYLVSLSPFLGARGGPCIEGEKVLTPQQAISGVRFDDVLYVNIHEALHGGSEEGFDVPYRILLPKGIDGLLVTGRGSAYIRRGHDPSGMRARPSMMVLGCATGTASAVCSRLNATPKTLDIRELQKELLRQGIFLGDRERLTELGLA